MLKKLFAAFMILCLFLSQASAIGEKTEIVVPVMKDMKVFDVPDTEPFQFVRELKTGWNLGNTFDANDVGSWFHGPDIDIESAWCGVKTPRELMTALKEAGFNLIRIPVSWHDHVDENDNINPEWLARVKEVAGWVIDEGMYAIVNVHHDNKPEYFYPDQKHYERSSAYLTSIWSQIAEAFADFDDHLILESMNEPRLTNTAYEWTWKAESAECQEAMACINQLNQLFVDTVRAAGGNNASRYLCIPSYDASPWYAVDSAFHLPEDQVENRLIVAAHAYTPYDFALNTKSNDNSFDLEKDAAKKSEIAMFMNRLYERFISQGIPVLMDEYGALNKNGNLQSRVNFAAYYVASASARGMTCCWWDNHNFTGNGEQFGLIDRKTCTWKYPEIVEAIMQNCMLGRE